MDVIVRRDDGRGTTVKGNINDGWSFDGVVLWFGRSQHGDAIEWWEESPKLILYFYSSGGWESGCPGRVTGGGDADSMVRFRLGKGREAIGRSVIRR
jgi:hypothetical protein